MEDQVKEQQDERLKEVQKMQDDYLREQITRGALFEPMAATEGWKIVANMVGEQVKSFANEAINGFANEKEYEARRNQLKGMLSVVNEVTSAIEVTKKQREANKNGKPTA